MFYPGFYLSVLLLLCFIFSSQEVFGVGGLSNTKVVVPSTETVPYKRYEIEPFFGLEFVDDELDSTNFEAGSRFTYGFTDNTEAGLNVGILSTKNDEISDTEYDFGNISPGIKYRFYEFRGSSDISIAYQGGLTIPSGGKDEKWLFEPLGMIITYNFGQNFSIDSDLVLMFEEDESWGITGNTGFGYFINRIIQPVFEIGYEFNDPDDGSNVTKLNLTGGFTAGVTDYLTVIIGVTRDVVSENSDESLEFTAAFTFLF